MIILTIRLILSEKEMGGNPKLELLQLPAPCLGRQLEAKRMLPGHE
ncbi:MAG: hypothetical protein HQK60_04565 [Deltaproteobacteria bacterium]|nr:hypothetical protein [Deltaproteobacteria bacterium]